MRVILHSLEVPCFVLDEYRGFPIIIAYTLFLNLAYRFFRQTARYDMQDFKCCAFASPQELQNMIHIICTVYLGVLRYQDPSRAMERDTCDDTFRGKVIFE
jgi:hypothetical protein